MRIQGKDESGSAEKRKESGEGGRESKQAEIVRWESLLLRKLYAITNQENRG